MKRKIYITDYIHEPVIEKKILGSDHQVFCLNTEDERKFPEKFFKEAEGILVWHAKISEYTLSRLKRCRGIVRYGVGIDNVDASAASQYEIPFANTPDYGVDEVADTTLAMMLSLLRRLDAYKRIAANFPKNWQENILPGIQRLREINLGIIGLGRIGTAVALRAKAFGLNIFFFDPYKPSGHEKVLGIERCRTLRELLKKSQVITLHAPLNLETRGMVNLPFIRELRQAILINTARGGLMQSLDVLYEGLKKGNLAGLGLDVLPEEPPQASHPFFKKIKSSHDWQDRIIVNPHTAYYSDQAAYEMRVKAASNLRRALEGNTMDNLIIPSGSSKISLKKEMRQV